MVEQHSLPNGNHRLRDLVNAHGGCPKILSPSATPSEDLIDKLEHAGLDAKNFLSSGNMHAKYICWIWQSNFFRIGKSSRQKTVTHSVKSNLHPSMEQISGMISLIRITG
jgi:hypothetical protein